MVSILWVFSLSLSAQDRAHSWLWILSSPLPTFAVHHPSPVPPECTSAQPESSRPLSRPAQAFTWLYLFSHSPTHPSSYSHPHSINSSTHGSSKHILHTYYLPDSTSGPCELWDSLAPWETYLLRKVKTTCENHFIGKELHVSWQIWC